MPRVIAGTAGGRRLQAPPGKNTRPTGDRVKEALFSSLGDLTGAVVIDLFAGSGQLGIEALSRGAAHATFVERDRRTVGVIRSNLDTAGVTDRATVCQMDTKTFVADPSAADPVIVHRPADLVVCDPPYAVTADLVGALLDVLVTNNGVAKDATVVVERDRRTPLDSTQRLAITRQRSYGDTVLCVLTAQKK